MQCVRDLHAEGLRVLMLTGDNQATAKGIARQIGINEVIAEVLPADKAEVVARLQREGHVVAMAGDGTNDAPALAKSDVGLAMGTGTDVAMESAGITLVKGDLRGVARARRLSRQTMAAIRQKLSIGDCAQSVGRPSLVGSTAASTMRSGSCGSEITPSVMRIKTVSTAPPK